MIDVEKIPVGLPITGLTTLNGDIYFYTETGLYRIQGPKKPSSFARTKEWIGEFVRNFGSDIIGVTLVYFLGVVSGFISAIGFFVVLAQLHAR